MTIPAIAPWAKEYVGLPFRNGGRLRAGGLDCYGLLRLIYSEQFEIVLPEFVGYRDCNDPQEIGPFLSHSMRSDWRLIEAGTERPGDGILLRCKGMPMHIGVIIGSGKMVHAFAGIDVCIEDYRGPTWNKRLLGFYRHAQVAQ